MQLDMAYQSTVLDYPLHPDYGDLGGLPLSSHLINLLKTFYYRPWGPVEPELNTNMTCKLVGRN